MGTDKALHSNLYNRLLTRVYKLHGNKISVLLYKWDLMIKPTALNACYTVAI
jgi:hypothetical protein